MRERPEPRRQSGRVVRAFGWKLMSLEGWQALTRKECGGVVVRGPLGLVWKGTVRCVGIAKLIACANCLGSGRRLSEAGPRLQGRGPRGVGAVGERLMGSGAPTPVTSQ